MVDFCPDDTPQLKAWRGEVRAFLEAELPGGMTFDYDYDEDEAGWDAYLAFWRKVGAKKWIGLTWPEEFGGLGRSAIERWILQEEFAEYAAPSHPIIGMAVAAGLLRHGTHAQRLRHLPGIASGAVQWGEGYSEPGSGSDLASLTTRAHLDGDHWVLNGQKTLGTAAHRAQWMSVLARTDPEAPGHSAISCFLVPLDAPGIQMLPLHNMADGQQNQTFFDNVRLPADSLLGDVNKAWNQIWFGLGGEALDPPGPSPDPYRYRIVRMLRKVMSYCRETRHRGRPLMEDPVVRLQLAELLEGVEAIRTQYYESYSNAVTGITVGPRPIALNLHQAYYKEFWPRFAQTCMEIVGPMAQIQGGRWACLNGELEHYFRGSVSNHAGGTSQLKRMVLATRGLGLPR